MATDARELRTKELRKLEAGLDHRQRLLMNRRREAADHAREAALLQKLVRDRLMDVKTAIDEERAECDLADVDEKKDSVVAKLEWTARVVVAFRAIGRSRRVSNCSQFICRGDGGAGAVALAEVRINLNRSPCQLKARQPGRGYASHLRQSRSRPERDPAQIVHAAVAKGRENHKLIHFYSPVDGWRQLGHGSLRRRSAFAQDLQVRWPHGTSAASFGASRQTAQRRASSSSRARASAASARAAWRACCCASRLASSNSRSRRSARAEDSASASSGSRSRNAPSVARSRSAPGPVGSPSRSARRTSVAPNSAARPWPA